MSESTHGEFPDVSAAAGARPAMPLAFVSVGQEVELADVRGGRQLQHRLAEMGLRPGVRFRVLARGRPGPFIICLNEARLILGHGMVPRILVR